MHIEYEATFTDIDKHNMRERLKDAGGVLVRPEYLQKRIIFDLPAGHQIENGWVRVRDEGDKVTISLKITTPGEIEGQREMMLVVDDFVSAVELLEHLGLRQVTYQESKRELWRLGTVDVTIDEWPFLEPFVELEGLTEAEVKAVAHDLALDYATAKFCAIGTLYQEKYGRNIDFLHSIKRLVFAMDNPFISEEKK